jgi:hypothetical protein
MNYSKNTVSVSVFVILFVALAMLKTVGAISWSWLWVSAPLWAPPLAFVIFIVLFGGLVMSSIGFAKLLKKDVDKNE